MLIANYGLHWHVDRVYWGKGRSPGQMLGVGKVDGAATGKGVRYPKVDFREQIGIYALYDHYQLIYVGQAGGRNTSTIFKRLKDHRKDHLTERWDRFSWFGIKPVVFSGNDGAYLGEPVFNQDMLTAKTVVNFLEAIVLEVTDKLLNRQGGQLGNAVKFKQCLHAKACGTIDDRIAQISNINLRLEESIDFDELNQ